jgi:hypothetical protein
LQEGGKKIIEELTLKNKFLEKQRNELLQVRKSNRPLSLVGGKLSPVSDWSTSFQGLQEADGPDRRPETTEASPGSCPCPEVIQVFQTSKPEFEFYLGEGENLAGKMMTFGKAGFSLMFLHHG